MKNKTKHASFLRVRRHWRDETEVFFEVPFKRTGGIGLKHGRSKGGLIIVVRRKPFGKIRKITKTNLQDLLFPRRIRRETK